MESGESISGSLLGDGIWAQRPWGGLSTSGPADLLGILDFEQMYSKCCDFLLNIAKKRYVFRIHFPAILPRRETILLLYLAGKSIIQDTAEKSDLRADFLSNFLLFS